MNDHGGPDALGVPAHDFSTNSNACGPCPAALAALRHADPARYPDPAYSALRQRLAGFHGVAVRRIVLAASASEFIFRITAAVARLGGRAVLMPNHGYGDYARAALAWGLRVLRADATVQDDAQLAWCCDPSSPLGQASPGLGGRVDALCATAAVVLDLAYEPLRLQGHLALNDALGWTCLASEANFFCVLPALPHGMTLRHALGNLRAHGLKLRDCTSFGLPGHLRVSVQPPVAQDALRHAWQQLVGASR